MLKIKKIRLMLSFKFHGLITVPEGLLTSFVFFSLMDTISEVFYTPCILIVFCLTSYWCMCVYTRACACVRVRVLLCVCVIWRGVDFSPDFSSLTRMFVVIT